MAWVYLLLAGLCEVGFTTCLKLSDGLTRLWPSVGFAVLLTASMGLLTVAARDIPLGTAYAVWTGIGAAGTALIGIVAFKDPATFGRLFFLTLLIGSVIGLKLVSPEQMPAPLPPPPPPAGAA
jgi:quaternary ammonium compound-resistance protein SugE